jgi:hypothetical protein
MKANEVPFQETTCTLGLLYSTRQQIPGEDSNMQQIGCEVSTLMACAYMPGDEVRKD